MLKEKTMKAGIRSKARKALDARLLPLGGDHSHPEARFKVPPKGWIRAIRDVLGMSSQQLANRATVRSSQTVDDWEKKEANDSIQLKTLRRAAEAMDCVLIYAFVPKTSLEETVRSRARKIAMRDLGRVIHTMRLEDQGTDNTDLEAQIDEYIRDNLKDREIWNDR
jgi:predicted DNA-binding mobile mystery protein A